MMKRLPASLLLLIGLASSSPAQDTTTASVKDNAPLQVVRFSWAKYRPSRLSMETGMPGAEAGPDERLEDLRLQRQVALERRRPPQMRSNPTESVEERHARRQRRLPEPPASASTTSSRAPVRRGDGYRYSVELQNVTQDKKVRVVEWDYVFVEPVTNKELLRHGFTSKVEIEAGKRKKITVESEAAPYAVVDVKGMDGDEGGEKIEIKRVVYADKTAWERPDDSQMKP